MLEQAFVIVRDARGSLVHVRNVRTGECVGCIEVGLYEIVRGLIAAEVGSEKAIAGSDRQTGG